MKLNIAYFYPKELNLYGDTGNVEILISRAKARGIQVAVDEVTSSTKLDNNFLQETNLVFMGGGPDSGQRQMYRDLLENKKDYLAEYVANEGSSLFICGAYQLMGHYYKFSDGSVLDGLGIFDMYTEHYGHSKTRCVGNITCTLNKKLLQSRVFKSVNRIGDTLVGFENHGGHTYLNDKEIPLAKVTSGFGNNEKDSSEGVIHNSTIGTYLHGPFLSKNPHVADFLIAKALKEEDLPPLDDTIIKKAHAALLNRFK